MIPETVIGSEYTENRNACNSEIPVCVIAPALRLGHPVEVLTTVELIARLEERGIRNADIARALGVSPSRVTEMKKGERAIKLDEAAKLVAEFGLESGSSQKVPPLPAPVAALIVQHVAKSLGSPLEEGSSQLQALSEDLRAFAEYVSDPVVRERIDLAMAFFQAMRLRNPSPQEADSQGTETHSAK